MENEIFQEYQENIVEAQENNEANSPADLVPGTELEEVTPESNNAETLEALSQIVAEYLEDKAISEDMESIETREASIPVVESLTRDDLHNELLSFFNFSDSGSLLVSTEKNNLFTEPLYNYSVEEGLLLLIFFVIFAKAVFVAIANLTFFRKGL